MLIKTEDLEGRTETPHHIQGLPASNISSHPYMGVWISTRHLLCLRITYVQPTGGKGEGGCMQSLPNFPTALEFGFRRRSHLGECWSGRAWMSASTLWWFLKRPSMIVPTGFQVPLRGFMQKRICRNQTAWIRNSAIRVLLNDIHMNVPIHYLCFFFSFFLQSANEWLVQMFHWHLLSPPRRPGLGFRGAAAPPPCTTAWWGTAFSSWWFTHWTL